MNYVITTCSQQIYTRAHLLLYLVSGGSGMHFCYPLGIWSCAVSSNESGISERRSPEGFRRWVVVDGKLCF